MIRRPTDTTSRNDIITILCDISTTDRSSTKSISHMCRYNSCQCRILCRYGIFFTINHAFLISDKGTYVIGFTRNQPCDNMLECPFSCSTKFLVIISCRAFSCSPADSPFCYISTSIGHYVSASQYRCGFDIRRSHSHDPRKHYNFRIIFLVVTSVQTE